MLERAAEARRLAWSQQAHFAVGDDVADLVARAQPKLLAHLLGQRRLTFGGDR